MLRIVFLMNVALFGIAMVVWGVYGTTLSVFLNKTRRPISANSTFSPKSR